MPHTFQPTAAPSSASLQPTQVLRLSPQPVFDLAVHPEQWTLVQTPDGLEWLPDVTPVRYRNGINGARIDVFKHPNGAVEHRIQNLPIARSEHIKAGYRFIERDSPAGDFMGQIPTASGTHHGFVWESYRQEPGYKPEKVVDAEAKIAFQRKLVSEGVVSRPPESFRRNLIVLAQQAVDKWEATKPSRRQAEGLERAVARLEALQSTPITPVEKTVTKGKAAK